MAHHIPQIAVVGCGGWGRNLIRNFHQLGALAGICSAHDDPHHQKICDDHGVPLLHPQDILENPQIEGVVVATPSNTHFELAKTYLAAGKHLFVEKPLVTRSDQARTLDNLAQEKDRILMVGHLMRYHPAFQRLQEIIGAGDLGEILHIYSSRLNLGKFLTHENIIWDCAPHDLSMILALYGEAPTTVTATGAAHTTHPHVDMGYVTLNFSHKRHAHIHLSRLHPFKEQKLVVIGSKAMAVLDDTQDWGQKLTLHAATHVKDGSQVHAHRGDIHPIPLEKAEPLKLECQHFLDCIRTGQAPHTPAREAILGLEILEATDRSLAAGASVSLENPSLPQARQGNS